MLRRSAARACRRTHVVVAVAAVLTALVGTTAIAAEGGQVVPADAATGWDHVGPPPPDSNSAATWCYALPRDRAGQTLMSTVMLPDGNRRDAEATVGEDGLVELVVGIVEGGDHLLESLALDDGTVVAPAGTETNTVAFDPELAPCVSTLTPAPAPATATAPPTETPSETPTGTPTEVATEPATTEGGPTAPWVVLVGIGVIGLAVGTTMVRRKGGDGTGENEEEDEDDEPRDVGAGVFPVGTEEDDKLHAYSLRLVDWDLLHTALGLFPSPSARRKILANFKGEKPDSPWLIDESWSARLLVTWRVVRAGKPEPGTITTMFDMSQGGGDAAKSAPLRVTRRLETQLTAKHLAATKDLDDEWADCWFDDARIEIVDKRDRPVPGEQSEEARVEGQLVFAAMIMVPPAAKPDSAAWKKAVALVDTYVADKLAAAGAAAGTALAGPGFGTVAGAAGGAAAKEGWSMLTTAVGKALDDAKQTIVIPILWSRIGGVSTFEVDKYAGAKKKLAVRTKATRIPLNERRSTAQRDMLALGSDDEVLEFAKRNSWDPTVPEPDDVNDQFNDDHWTLWGRWEAHLCVVRHEVG